jgi:DNA-binding response OmpR family regulator
MRFPPSFPDLSILVVDRSPNVRRILTEILAQVNLRRIFEAADAAVGTTLFFDKQPNIVFLDWDLPKGGAANCLGSIRSSKSWIVGRAPVIVTMERPTLSSVVKAEQTGANEVLAKPFSPKVVWQHLFGVINITRKFQTDNGLQIPTPRVVKGNDI